MSGVQHMRLDILEIAPLSCPALADYERRERVKHRRVRTVHFVLGI